MALLQATIKATIEAEMLITFGAPADADQQEKFTEAISQAIYKILTVQAQVALANGGIDTGGFPLVLNQGSIL